MRKTHTLPPAHTASSSTRPIERSYESRRRGMSVLRFQAIVGRSGTVILWSALRTDL